MESKAEPIEVTLARHLAAFRMRMSSIWAKGEGAPGRHSILFLLCIGVAINCISIASPGYLGPEEQAHQFLGVEGASFRIVIDRIKWFNFSEMHYRPITFLIWHVLSFFLYETPVLFLLSKVLMTAFNGILLYHLVLRFSGSARAAMWAFLVFIFFPPTAFIGGWAATITDNLYMACVLGAVHILLSDRNAAMQHPPPPPRTRPLTSFASLETWKLGRVDALRQAGVALLFIVGLMSKDTMLVFPAFVAGLCLMVKPWRGWWWSLAISILILGIYLALRWKGLIHAANIGEVLSIGRIFHHMLAYWVYPFVWGNFYLNDVMVNSSRLQLFLAGILASLPVLFLLWQRKWRYSAAYLGYYYVFVSPVLIAAGTRANLLYGAVLPMAVVFVYALRRGADLVRMVACGLLVVLALHSANIQWEFYKRGVMQQRAYHTLAATVRQWDLREGHSDTSFAIIAEDGRGWILLYNSFWPDFYHPTRNILGLDLHQRVSVHHRWQGPWHEIPEGAVRLLLTPKGYLVEVAE